MCPPPPPSLLLPLHVSLLYTLCVKVSILGSPSARATRTVTVPRTGGACAACASTVPGSGIPT